MGYMDMTWCVCDPHTPKCKRIITDQVLADARRWWGEEGEPPFTVDYLCNPEQGESRRLSMEPKPVAET